MTKAKIQEKLKTYFVDIKKLTELEKEPEKNYIEQEEDMDSLWIDLKEEENVGEFGLSLLEWEEVVRTSLQYIQTKERQYRRFPKRMIEKTLDNLLPGAENGRSLVRFIIYQLSRLKNVNQSTTQDSSKTQLHDRAARIIAYTISGIQFSYLIMQDLAQRYIIPIPTLELMKNEEIPQQKIEKKTIILLAKNVICRKYNIKEGNFTNYLSMSRTDTEELGPLKVKIPFYYEEPMKKLEELKNREKDLIERLDFLKKLGREFNEMNDEEKNKLSLVLSLHSMNELKNIKQELNIELPPNNSIIPMKYLEKEYEKSLHRAIKKQKFQEKKFPSFIDEISNITNEEINSILKFKERKLKVDITFVEFKKLVEVGGIFHHTDVVQNLLNHIDSPNSVDILYDWVINGRDREDEKSRLKMMELLRKLTKHSKTKNGMLEIEEYCLVNLKRNPNSIGENFILEFMKSLNETVESEKYNPEELELHDEYRQNQKILRQGAYQFLSFAFRDQFNMEIELPSFHEEDEAISKLKSHQYQRLIEEFQKEQPFEPVFSQEQLQFQFLPPALHRSEVYSTTNNRRKELFSELKKK